MPQKVLSNLNICMKYEPIQFILLLILYIPIESLLHLVGNILATISRQFLSLKNRIIPKLLPIRLIQSRIIHKKLIVLRLLYLRRSTELLDRIKLI